MPRADFKCFQHCKWTQEINAVVLIRQKLPIKLRIDLIAKIQASVHRSSKSPLYEFIGTLPHATYATVVSTDLNSLANINLSNIMGSKILSVRIYFSEMHKGYSVG